eukprot:c12796_g1_i1.p1 GENE.c12796_g1_i1~~c12796_g1_i1.p1  ORF type:complete len:248 (-),score=56.02 c12796_g1_i1:37-780(-)
MTNAVRHAAPVRKARKFVTKTFDLINELGGSSDVIGWVDAGDAFFFDEVKLSRHLPQYFKHDNVTSFIRQLNNYGFHGRNEGGSIRVFAHPAFRAGEPDLLGFVARKTIAAKPARIAADAVGPALAIPIPIGAVADCEAEEGAQLAREVGRLRSELLLLDGAQRAMVGLIETASMETELLRSELRAARESQAVLQGLVSSVAAYLQTAGDAAAAAPAAAGGKPAAKAPEPEPEPEEEEADMGFDLFD